jgi:hypothetical protein
MGQIARLLRRETLKGEQPFLRFRSLNRTIWPHTALQTLYEDRP